MQIDLNGRVALVTGGSRGIGAAIVGALHASGASVYFVYHKDREAADAVEKRLGTRVASAQCDIGDHQLLPDLVDSCVAKFGSLDILVNNAAVQFNTSIDTESYGEWHDSWTRTLAVNLEAPAHLSWLAIREMRKRGSGTIVNIASRAGQRGAWYTAYAASKAGMIGLTRSLARSAGQYNITAYCIAPSYIETDLARRYLEGRRQAIERETPLHRLGTADEVGALAVFLVSSYADYATGSTIDFNGGSYLH